MHVCEVGVHACVYMRCVCEVCVCVCEVYVCEVGMDTQQSFAAMLCVGYKFGRWGEKTTSFPGGNYFPVHDRFSTGEDGEASQRFLRARQHLKYFSVLTPNNPRGQGPPLYPISRWEVE